MPWFEIAYAKEPTGKSLHSQRVMAGRRAEAVVVAQQGFAKAHGEYGAECYRVIDGSGMVVARGP